jgi:rhamnosyltransferase
MTVGSPRSDIGAVVVLFNPEQNVIANIRSYRDQVSRVVAVDNTPRPHPETARELADDGIEYFALGENKGIAAALNVGCRAVRDAGCDWALTMDQDSTAPEDLVGGLLTCLATGPTDVAIVAPLWEQVGGLSLEAAATCSEIDWAMTSGNLLKLEAWDAVGGFREELFIDQVDNELCFRLRLADWRILQSHRAVLQHRQGNLRRSALGFYITDYSALRRYYRTRNTLLVRREYGERFPAWVAAEREDWTREIVKMVLAEPNRLDKLHKIYQGWRDARAGRLGKYEVLHG